MFLSGAMFAWLIYLINRQFAYDRLPVNSLTEYMLVNFAWKLLLQYTIF